MAQELDIFNPQISTVAKGLQGKILLVYGTNGVGKTKVATQMEKPYYLGFEAGINAIAGVPFANITRWSDFIKLNKQLTDLATVNKAKEMYSTIIFDEVSAAARMCQSFICQKFKATSIKSGNEGYGLWAEYEDEFASQIVKLTNAGYCVYFIAHAEQEKDGFIVPKGDKRSIGPVRDIADLCVYVQSNGVDENGKVIKSSGFLAQSDTYFARSRFDYLPYTCIPEFSAKALEEVIVKAIEIQEQEEGITAVTFEEQKEQRTVKAKSYDDLMGEMQEFGERISSSGRLEDLQIIVANHLGEGRLASELKRGQEQIIQVIVDELKMFVENECL
jgi:hypothetical protein